MSRADHIASTGLGRLFRGQTAVDFYGTRRIGLLVAGDHLEQCGKLKQCPLEADALIGVLPLQVVGGYRWSGNTEWIDLSSEL